MQPKALQKFGLKQLRLHWRVRIVNLTAWRPKPVAYDVRDNFKSCRKITLQGNCSNFSEGFTMCEYYMV